MSMIASPTEFHLGLRVTDLDTSTAFYTAFLGVGPKDRTARFSTFIVPALHLNLVLLVSDSDQPPHYARLTAVELAAMPADQEPIYLVPGTAPDTPAAPATPGAS